MRRYGPRAVPHGKHWWNTLAKLRLFVIGAKMTMDQCVSRGRVLLNAGRVSQAWANGCVAEVGLKSELG